MHRYVVAERFPAPRAGKASSGALDLLQADNVRAGATPLSHARRLSMRWRIELTLAVAIRMGFYARRTNAVFTVFIGQRRYRNW